MLKLFSKFLLITGLIISSCSNNIKATYNSPQAQETCARYYMCVIACCLFAQYLDKGPGIASYLNPSQPIQHTMDENKNSIQPCMKYYEQCKDCIDNNRKKCPEDCKNTKSCLQDAENKKKIS